MQSQQIERIQKRLQSRKDKERRYRKPQYRYSSQSDIIGHFNEVRKKRLDASPGKLYVRSINPKSYHTLVTLDNDMAQIDSSQKEDDLQKNKSFLLPQLKPNHSSAKYNRQKIKSLNHQNPTRSSKQRNSPENTVRKQQKRICSVHCKSRNIIQSNQKTPNKKNIQKKESKIERFKILKQKQKDRHRKNSSQLSKYLESEAQTKYPTSQLQRYLLKAKRSEQTQQQYYELQNIEYKNLYYETYFGMQPEFHKLLTQYAKQMNKIPDLNQVSHLSKQHILPSIPEQKHLASFVQRYVTYGKDINIQLLIKQKNFYIQYSPDQLFFGEIIGDRREGVGILLNQHSCFQGIFKEGFKVKGIQVLPSGIYRGDFYLNKREGVGKFQGINGQTYIGDWKQGFRHGNGIWTNRKGDSYNGQWARGKGKGYGIFVSQGNEYHGDFFQFKKDGFGRESLSNGDSYEGGFKKGYPEGKGSYIWSNGTKYEGQFQHGLRSGQGTLTTLDGFVYNGQFREQKPQGLCKLSMPNGEFYEGYLHRGKKNGRGVLTFKDIKLDGYWKQDRFLTKAFI